MKVLCLILFACWDAGSGCHRRMRIFGVGRAWSEFFVSTNPQNDWLANCCCPGKQRKNPKSHHFFLKLQFLKES